MNIKISIPFAAILLLVAPTLAGADRPNVVFFLIDDLGWTDLGFQGSRFYESPHIDRLAATGMVFTDAYANAPNCAPSRACLMSGLYTPRHGIYTVGDPVRGNHPFRKLQPSPNKTVLADRFVTIAECLRAAGYKTAAMGKWHLGPDPTSQGFDVNIAGREWGSPSGGGYHSPYKYPNLAQRERGEYLTDRLTDEAIKFIRANRDESFFLYLSHYAVHTPIQAKESLTEKYRRKEKDDRHKNAAYAAMIESVDDSVGRVLGTLGDLDLDDNTVVVFFSDNGGFGGATSNAPLRGSKGMLYEGGIREPLIVKWPGVTEPGSRCAVPVIGVDFYPTLLDITAAETPDRDQLDGVSLLPLLRDAEATLSRDALFWHFPCYLQGGGGRDPDRPFRTTPAGAIRQGNWKLIEYFEDGGVELFDLAEDLGEQTNLAEKNPEKAAELLASLRKWRKSTSAPVPTTPNPRYDPNAKPKRRRKKSR
ncbi:MAG: sulfatase [Pirellulaceae bacterium]|jgi:arylsulfatase A-like enzyme|nr:sulfatase [Pirellulaceae bacterium]MDP7015812.1 sulfatase [Pirellulaceae bacterium]